MITDKDTIKTAIETTLAHRMQALGMTYKGSRPSKKYLHEQAAFIAGATTALQAVFGDECEQSTLTDKVPVGWIISILRGDDIVAKK